VKRFWVIEKSLRLVWPRREAFRQSSNGHPLLAGYRSLGVLPNSHHHSLGDEDPSLGDSFCLMSKARRPKVKNTTKIETVAGSRKKVFLVALRVNGGDIVDSHRGQVLETALARSDWLVSGTHSNQKRKLTFRLANWR
jgi:hypothetical protein